MPDLPAIALGPSRPAARAHSRAHAHDGHHRHRSPRNSPAATSTAVAVDVPVAIPAAASAPPFRHVSPDQPSLARPLRRPGPDRRPRPSRPAGRCFRSHPTRRQHRSGPFVAPASPFPRSPEKRTKPRLNNMAAPRIPKTPSPKVSPGSPKIRNPMAAGRSSCKTTPPPRPPPANPSRRRQHRPRHPRHDHPRPHPR